ncbi:hypothetical protein [Candidatus Neptunochlamydia vexilliferae]|uniref:Uncharacterized protein n=1 Tax=Candidatus Neptunichlamydia vexilliferae TaxID=1651774 RepID=A0ABS0AZU5_9BACT|nr:hypothetical protein [Candidatus Neptunochlamydia vexilliferae]MBF5059657.1 hypothetical protein [Candidatus Neptunochlamydia vexilliferae]
MAQISPVKHHPQPPSQPPQILNNSWKAFGFSKEHEKVFLRNLSHHFSQMIYRNMRKMKETARKFREENR